MKIGFIGLGKMGKNMALNLLEKKHQLVVYNRSPQPVKELQKKKAIGAFSIEEFAKKMPSQKIIIMMVTAGKPVDNIINSLLPYLKKGDILVDAGNSFYKNSIDRYNMLKRKGISYIDMGTSGGLKGARDGASLTVGGDKNAFVKIEKLCKDLSVKGGYTYVGPAGAGHFVKMVHNGIEYSLLEAYGEGYEILFKAPYKFDFKKIAKVWNNGSIIGSKILEMSENVFKNDPALKKFTGRISGGETGSWCLLTADREKVEAESLRHALKKRRNSLWQQSYSTKFVSAIRKEFGGHKEV